MKHVHAELMALYAQDAMETDKPWERWEYSSQRGLLWLDCDKNPSWFIDHKYRRKPRTIKVNGFDVPEPMREVSNGSLVYWASPDCKEFFSALDFTDKSEWRKLILSRGLLHSTKEAAAKHAMAMCGIDPATYKEEE